MLLSRRLWAVLLVGLLVAGLLVGFGDGDEAVAKEPRATLGKIMITAAAFAPGNQNDDFANNGFSLAMYSGSGVFHAQVWFPVPVVNVHKITLLAYDNDPGAGNDVTVILHRAHPLIERQYLMGYVGTKDSDESPQRVSTRAIEFRRVNTINQVPYIELYIGAPILQFYGVQIVYSY